MTRLDTLRRRTIEAQPTVGRWVRVRVHIAGVVLGALSCGLVYRAHGLQIERGDHYAELARRQHLLEVEVPAPRGAIRDATGHELAITADIDSVYANPRAVVDVAGTAATIAEILGADVRTLEARLSSSRYFAWLERHVTPDIARAVADAGLPGIALAKEPRRYYPAQSLAGPILGFADIDGHGLEGLERTLDQLLRGERVELPALRDAAGHVMLPPETDALAARAATGATVRLTLDRSIQFFAERALGDAIAEHRAVAGTVVVLEVDSGSVLAMASWPTYNPNDPEGRKLARGGARNRALTDVFEAGSVMKVFTVAAALDAGAVRPDDMFDVSGPFRVGRKPIRDTYEDDRLTVGGVLKRSSNIGVVKIAQRLGRERLYEALRRFGFGQRTGIELPGEQPGLVWTADRWGELELATIAYGYGLAVTPLQLATAIAAIGNDGVLNEPRIVAEVVDAGGTRTRMAPRRAEGRRVLSATTAAALLPMLASVFDRGRDGGTARSIVVEGFRAGGKTGTSYKLDPSTGAYSDELFLSSFIGLAPIDAPRLAVVVLIDEPHGEHHYGGVVAGPVFARVVSESLRYLGVPGEPEADGNHDQPQAGPEGEPAPPEVIPIADPEPVTGDGHEPATLVPNFLGLSAGAALDRARTAGLEVQLVGHGRAVEQFPAPGWVSGPGGLSVRILFSEGGD
jgi:cell division protein FtsI (penicillin-binding protein 3)